MEQGMGTEACACFTVLLTVKRMLTAWFVEAAKAETLSRYKGCRYSMGRTPRVKTKREREDGRAVRLAPELRGHEAEASDSESNSQRTQG